MARLILMPSAWDDLDGITRYIAEKEARPEVARAILAEIYAKCEKYAEHPTIGQRFPTPKRAYRMFRHKRWVIFYLEIKDGIKVYRIVDGARDFDQLFGR